MITIPADGDWHPIEDAVIRVIDDEVSIRWDDIEGNDPQCKLRVDPDLPVIIREDWIGQAGQRCWKLDRLRKETVDKEGTDVDADEGTGG